MILARSLIVCVGYVIVFVGCVIVCVWYAVVCVGCVLVYEVCVWDVITCAGCSEGFVMVYWIFVIKSFCWGYFWQFILWKCNNKKATFFYSYFQNKNKLFFSVKLLLLLLLLCERKSNSCFILEFYKINLISSIENLAIYLSTLFLNCHCSTSF